MPAVDIPCPNCGRLLRLHDRSLLGRKGRCGKCSHKFILQEPGTVEIPEAERPSGGEINFESLDEHEGPALEPEFEGDVLSRARARQRLVQRRRKVTFAVSAVTLAAFGFGLYAVLPGARLVTTLKPQSRVGHARTERAADGAEVQSVVGLSEKVARPADPIALTLVPEGARIVIHLRPADLWKAGGPGDEFRACLGPLGTWLESAIKTHCLLPPAQIEEALFALIPISQEDFDVAVVVRSVGPIKRSELIDRGLGELHDQPRPHYVGPERAWVFFDSRTLAGSPSGMVQSLLESSEGPAVTSDGIQALLSKTDRNQHLTLVCDLEDVRLGAKTIAPEKAQDLLGGALDFFGDNVESLAWGLHLGDAESGRNLTSQVVVRNRLTRSAPKLREDLKKSLAALPAKVLNLVYKTGPKTIGETKIVGRLPMMTKIIERLARISDSPRLVSMQIELPERAGPNLAVATLLTWYQTTLPDFGKSSIAPSEGAAGESQQPDTIADRLKKKITVDFRRDFMYTAIEFIEGETGVKIKLDGQGMKEVGLTQNMYQTFSMDNVPATAVLHKIIVENSQKKLVLIVDEKQKIATVTSITTAENKKLTPFSLEPAAK